MRFAAQTAKGFGRNEDGAIAPIFGIAATAIVMIVGMAVDIGRAVHSNQRLGYAMDAAALAAAKGIKLEGLTDDQAITLAETVFNENMAQTSGTWTQINALSVALDRAKGSAEINVDASVPMAFAGVMGFRKIDLPKSAVAIFDSKDIEVSLQLDTTGSMSAPSGSGNTKIHDLRIATAELIDTLMPATPVAGRKLRIGIAPFSSGVNAGAYLRAVDGNRSSTTNCVYERETPTYQTTDSAPTALGALKIKADLTPGAQDCPAASVLPLTDDKSALKAKAASLAATGSTAGHLGTAWAWYLLSPVWNIVWNLPSPVAGYNDGKTMKFAILMTDGEYNTIGGFQSGGNVVRSSDTAVDTCNAMKAQGIVVYTVGFKLTDPRAISTLADCASGSSHAIRAEDGNELRAAFNHIATQIMSLRLSK